MRRLLQVAAAGLLAAAMGGGAASAQAADPADPAISWDASSVTAAYGDYWQLSANASAPLVLGTWSVTGSLTGGPSGYTATVSSYQNDPNTLVAYVTPPYTGRPLPAGTYSATLTMTGGSGSGPTVAPSGPATLTIAPAALTVTLLVAADPSNPANAIISSELTGPFRDSFFTTTYTEGPLPPVGSWHIEVTDENGDVVHEADIDRAEDEDIMGASSYWSDVPPGTYSVAATFTATGPSAGNFTFTQPAPVSYATAPAPGSTSTATPAPPAPPPATENSGLTLPLWIPLVAGILSAGLIALTIVQIVRLRRSGIPLPEAEPQGSGA